VQEQAGELSPAEQIEELIRRCGVEGAGAEEIPGC